jgi:hypothetical protein
MKKYITYIGIVIVILLVIFWGKIFSNSNSTSVAVDSGPVSSLIVSEKLFDFSTISMKDGRVEHIFKITNPTEKDVFVKKIATSCMCTNAYIESPEGEKGPFGMEGMGYLPPADMTIKAGETTNIKVVYDPNAHGPAGVGIVDRFITLSDRNNTSLELEIKAIVTP